MKQITVNSERQAQEQIAQLKRDGYKRTQNCFWYETWENGNSKVEIERDF